MDQIKKYLTFILLLSLIFIYSCEENEDIDTGDFKKIVDMETLNFKNDSTIMILDNKASQLFFYDVTSECFIDFQKNLPMKNGIQLPKYPYKLELSDDSNKAVVLSSNKILTLINTAPYIDYHKKNCSGKILPFIEKSLKLDYNPQKVHIKKADGFNYQIILTKSNFIDYYIYDGKNFNFIKRKEYDNEITFLYEYNDYYYISFKNTSDIIKFNFEEEETINISDSDITLKQIDKFTVNGKNIFIYDNYQTRFLVWNTETSSFEEIKGAYNPLDKKNVYPAKYLKLKYKINSMSIYKQVYNIKDDEKINDTGFLTDNQLLPGTYLLITDVGGYFYFITIDTDTSLINSYPNEKFENKDDYIKDLNKRFLKYQIPLLSEYNPEILTVIQPDYCTQFNKYEANECFSVINEEENSSNNRYILLSDEVKNREYDISSDYFKFTFEGGLKDFIADDGALLNDNTLFSEHLDFSKIKYPAEDLQLEIISNLPEDKKDDEKCSFYKTNENLENGESNRKLYRLIPIKNINGHNLILQEEKTNNLSYCYNEAFAFQIRIKNKFLVTSNNFGEIGTASYCTNDIESNPICKENNNKCPLLCSQSPYYENELFKIKIFSDKGNMDIDSYIAFTLGLNSTNARYNNHLISPLKSKTIFNTKHQKRAIAVIDSYNNNVVLIDSNNLKEILFTIH